MREIRLYSSEGGEVFNPLSLPLFLIVNRNRRRNRPPKAQVRATTTATTTDYEEMAPIVHRSRRPFSSTDASLFRWTIAGDDNGARFFWSFPPIGKIKA